MQADNGEETPKSAKSAKKDKKKKKVGDDCCVSDLHWDRFFSSHSHFLIRIRFPFHLSLGSSRTMKMEKLAQKRPQRAMQLLLL